MKKHLFFVLLILSLANLIANKAHSQNWILNGNVDADASSKLGTTNGQPLRLFTNNVERMRIDTLGKIGIGTTAPDASALLEITSTNKGVLLPRMTIAQRNAIPSPVNGLMVFQIDGSRGLWYYYNGSWNPVATSASAFANTALSNLVTTAINTNLLPGINNLRDLGSQSVGWRSLYLSGDIWIGDSRILSTTGANVALGSQALVSIIGGSGNTALGNFTLSQNTELNYLVAIGDSALSQNTAGDGNNTAIGSKAGLSTTTGGDNTFIGFKTGYSNTSGALNTYVGSHAGYLGSTQGANSAFGAYSLYNNSDANTNSAFGYFSMFNNTTGNSNTAMGAYSMKENTTGDANTGVGKYALTFSMNGSGNSAFGFSAGQFVNNPTNSTFLGAYADGFEYVSNSTAIGNKSVVSASNQVRIGNDDVTSIGGAVDWTTFSDGRFKKNMKENVPGLEFINGLRPLTYTLDVTSIAAAKNLNQQSKALTDLDIKATKEKEKIVYTGFVAQEVEKAAKKLNYDFSGVDAPQNGKDFYGLRYSEFVVPLVKAVQELSEKTDEIEELKKQNNELSARLKKLEELVNKSTSGTNLNMELSSAYLNQNLPNPFGQSTVIGYYLPENAGPAKMILTDMNGTVIKTLTITAKGKGNLTLGRNALAAGEYMYSLWIDGRQVDIKRMIITN
jgi:trimeric autotransporter adhesin